MNDRSYENIDVVNYLDMNAEVVMVNFDRVTTESHIFTS